MKIRTILVATASIALLVTPAAAAHVTLHPDKVPADSFQRFSFQVPVEKDIPTTKLKVQIPTGVIFVSVEPKPGWTYKTTTATVNPPIEMEGEKITERTATIEWSGGSIKPGEFDEFVISAHVPDEAGKTLIFPANQTYADGSVVRWIGALTADEPAPHVALEAAESENASATTTTAASSSTSDDDSDSNTSLWIAIIALVVGGVALVLGGLRWRRA
jgi:uncharacterized protein YcnI